MKTSYFLFIFKARILDLLSIRQLAEFYKTIHEQLSIPIKTAELHYKAT